MILVMLKALKLLHTKMQLREEKAKAQHFILCPNQSLKAELRAQIVKKNSLKPGCQTDFPSCVYSQQPLRQERDYSKSE